MATRRIKNHLTGEFVDAELVEITEMDNKPVMIGLEDGSRVRINFDIFQATRIPDSWDNEGHPIYNFRWGTTIAVLESPDELKANTGDFQ